VLEIWALEEAGVSGKAKQMAGLANFLAHPPASSQLGIASTSGAASTTWLEWRTPMDDATFEMLGV
jgi:hypothetical protein